VTTILAPACRASSPQRRYHPGAPTARAMYTVILQTSVLLMLSNLFMTVAWYAHLKNLSDRAWWVAALASWGVALFEYLLQVPANRIGYTLLTLPQLKIMQEAITLAVFVPFAVFYMKQPLSWNYLWAGFCLMGAVYFIFKG
jgi:uncharacterized protein (DUF486 family)